MADDLTNAFAPFGGGSTTDKAPYRANLPEDQMTRHAEGIEAEETRRYEQGLGTMMDAYRHSQGEIAKSLDPGLLWSKASDNIGARSKGALESMRRQLGASGRQPSQGLLSRLMMSHEGQLLGAERDITIHNKEKRSALAAQSMGDALKLAIQQQAPVSGIRYENAQNLFEGQLTREGHQAGVASNRAASKDNKMGSLGGGALGLAGSAITGGK